MLRTTKLFVFGEGSAALLRAYLIDRKFRLAVDRVRGRVARLQRMWEGAAERRRWEAIRDAEVHRQVEAELAAAAGSSYMGKIWYRLRRSRFQARLDAAGGATP